MRRIENDLLRAWLTGFTPEENLPDFPSSDADPLPEFYQYRDEGCQFASACLACPLPECIEEQPYSRLKLAKQQRDAEIVRLYLQKKRTYRQIAARFQISVRTVRRIIGQPRVSHPDIS
jgi:hypothetical protein